MDEAPWVNLPININIIIICQVQLLIPVSSQIYLIRAQTDRNQIYKLSVNRYECLVLRESALSNLPAPKLQAHLFGKLTDFIVHS